MSKFDVKDFQLSVDTLEEYEKVLEAYKVSNPVKYAVKLANGEFDKYRDKLKSKNPATESVEEPVTEPVDELVEEPVKKQGRPKKLNN